MGMERVATKVWTAPLLKKTFITVDERWFGTYVTDKLGAVSDCYIAQVLDDGEVHERGQATETYGADEYVAEK